MEEYEVHIHVAAVHTRLHTQVVKWQRNDSLQKALELWINHDHQEKTDADEARKVKTSLAVLS